MHDLMTLKRDWIALSREVGAIQVPEGTNAVLPKGTEVEVLQELGGDFTVRGRRGFMYRIDGADGDALGKTPTRPMLPRDATPLQGDALREAVMEQLRRCYDPEIPVNLLDLGLIYETELIESDDHLHEVHIKMTLTAPGCGMGQILVDDVKRKVEGVPGVKKANIELVFDPPWEPSMMSEAARLQAGLF